LGEVRAGGWRNTGRLLSRAQPSQILRYKATGGARQSHRVSIYVGCAHRREGFALRFLQTHQAAPGNSLMDEGIEEPDCITNLHMEDIRHTHVPTLRTYSSQTCRRSRNKFVPPLAPCSGNRKVRKLSTNDFCSPCIFLYRVTPVRGQVARVDLQGPWRGSGRWRPPRQTHAAMGRWHCPKHVGSDRNCNRGWAAIRRRTQHSVPGYRQ